MLILGLIVLAIAAIIILPACAWFTADKRHVDDSELWIFDSLDTIGGHSPELIDEPSLITEHDRTAVQFDGIDDGIVVDTHPLEGKQAFTVEIAFRPDAGGPPEQRFLHLQENSENGRILIETRLTDDGMWYLDTFIKSGEFDRTLADKTKLHALGEWYVATLVFDGREMRHYVNGALECSGTLDQFSPPGPGKTSIGVRLNRVYWFRGAVSQTRFTPRALTPDGFLKMK